MRILSVNSSSSTIQFLLTNSDGWEVIAKGACNNIGENAVFTYADYRGSEIVEYYDVPTHREAVQLVLKYLLEENNGVISDLTEIDIVGHRVAHGGVFFSEPVMITNEIIERIKAFSEIAPMDNPINLLCISVCRELMPTTPMVAVFDTSFHKEMPEKAYLYSIPYSIYQKYGVRRYGFRGSSHKYVSRQMARFLGLDINNSKEIICHLGSETAICAVKNGLSIENSMGFTPMSGIGMGTRSGDLDPYIVAYLAAKLKLDSGQVIGLLNRESGLLGLTNGLSSDIREIEEEAENGNELAKVAIDVYSYNIAKAIGSCVTALNGTDAIAFTAGVGEHSKVVRKKVCSYLNYLGIDIDDGKNEKIDGNTCISSADSRVKVCVIPTNEELEICKEAFEMIGNMKELYLGRK